MLQLDEKYFWDFPGGPVAKTPRCHCRGGPDMIPDQGKKNPMAQLRHREAK